MEKERYEYIPRTIDNDEFIYDIELNDLYESDLIYDLEECCGLLNKQDRRIKELEESVKTKETINNLYKATLDLKDSDFRDLVTANVELKKHQKQIAIEELEKSKQELRNHIQKMNNDEHCYPQNAILWEVIVDTINKRIEELKG